MNGCQKSPCLVKASILWVIGFGFKPHSGPIATTCLGLLVVRSTKVPCKSNQERSKGAIVMRRIIHHCMNVVSYLCQVQRCSKSPGYHFRRHSCSDVGAIVMRRI